MEATVALNIHEIVNKLILSYLNRYKLQDTLQTFINECDTFAEIRPSRKTNILHVLSSVEIQPDVCGKTLEQIVDGFVRFHHDRPDMPFDSEMHKFSSALRSVCAHFSHLCGMFDQSNISQQQMSFYNKRMSRMRNAQPIDVDPGNIPNAEAPVYERRYKDEQMPSTSGVAPPDVNSENDSQPNRRRKAQPRHLENTPRKMPPQGRNPLTECIKEGLAKYLPNIIESELPKQMAAAINRTHPLGSKTPPQADQCDASMSQQPIVIPPTPENLKSSLPPETMQNICSTVEQEVEQDVWSNFLNSAGIDIFGPEANSLGAWPDRLDTPVPCDNRPLAGTSPVQGATCFSEAFGLPKESVIVSQNRPQMEVEQSLQEGSPTPTAPVADAQEPAAKDTNKEASQIASQDPKEPMATAVEEAATAPVTETIVEESSKTCTPTKEQAKVSDEQPIEEPEPPTALPQDQVALIAQEPMEANQEEEAGLDESFISIEEGEIVDEEEKEERIVERSGIEIYLSPKDQSRQKDPSPKKPGEKDNNEETREDLTEKPEALRRSPRKTVNKDRKEGAKVEEGSKLKHKNHSKADNASESDMGWKATGEKAETRRSGKKASSAEQPHQPASTIKVVEIDKESPEAREKTPRKKAVDPKTPTLPDRSGTPEENTTVKSPRRKPVETPKTSTLPDKSNTPEENAKEIQKHVTEQTEPANTTSMEVKTRRSSRKASSPKKKVTFSVASPKEKEVMKKTEKSEVKTKKRNSAESEIPKEVLPAPASKAEKSTSKSPEANKSNKVISKTKDPKPAEKDKHGAKSKEPDAAKSSKNKDSETPPVDPPASKNKVAKRVQQPPFASPKPHPSAAGESPLARLSPTLNSDAALPKDYKIPKKFERPSTRSRTRVQKQRNVSSSSERQTSRSRSKSPMREERHRGRRRRKSRSKSPTIHHSKQRTNSPNAASSSGRKSAATERKAKRKSSDVSPKRNDLKKLKTEARRTRDLSVSDTDSERATPAIPKPRHRATAESKALVEKPHPPKEDEMEGKLPFVAISGEKAAELLEQLTSCRLSRQENVPPAERTFEQEEGEIVEEVNSSEPQCSSDLNVVSEKRLDVDDLVDDDMISLENDDDLLVLRLPEESGTNNTSDYFSLVADCEQFWDFKIEMQATKPQSNTKIEHVLKLLHNRKS